MCVGVKPSCSGHTEGGCFVDLIYLSVCLRQVQWRLPLCYCATGLRSFSGAAATSPSSLPQTWEQRLITFWEKWPDMCSPNQQENTMYHSGIGLAPCLPINNMSLSLLGISYNMFPFFLACEVFVELRRKGGWLCSATFIKESCEFLKKTQPLPLSLGFFL